MLQAEALAVEKTCNMLADESVLGKRINICSDSESDVKALSSCMFSVRSVLEIREALDELSKNNEISLVWVSDQSGIRWNVRAEELARSGSADEFIGLEPSLEVNVLLGTDL